MEVRVCKRLTRPRDPALRLRIVFAEPMQSQQQIEVFFDGDCPLCVREASFLRKRDRDQRILFSDISAPDFDAASTGIAWEQLMDRIHGRLPDGTVVEGVEVFRRLYTAIGWGWLVPATRVAGISHLLDLGYRLFAKNRLKLTGRCDHHEGGACRVAQRPGVAGAASASRAQSHGALGGQTST